MYLFEEVMLRLKEKLNITSDKEMYDYMGVSQGTFSNWKNRNKIPYELLTTICFEKNINIKYILKGKKEQKEIINLNFKEENIKNIEKLNEKNQELYYHLLKSEILKQEK